jgi:hypothetical protein
MDAGRLTYARSDVPGGREVDAERFSALVEALTGKRPRVYRMKDGKIMIECYEGHLEGFARYAELAKAIMERLKETSRLYLTSVTQIVRTPTTPTGYVPLRYRPAHNGFSTTV